MPNYFIDTNATNICVTCLNTVIRSNTKTNNEGGGVNNNSKISKIRSILKTRASAPNANSSGCVAFSDFRSAQVLTGCAKALPETTSTYCDCNNGKVHACLYPNTVLRTSTSNGTKYYEFKLGGGSFVTQTNDCTKSYTNLNSGSRDLIMRDGTTDANICQRVKVGYGGSTKYYNCIQDKTNPSLN